MAGEVTRWKPGQSGNPSGRPKGDTLTTRIRTILEKSEINGKPLPNGKTVADLVAELIVKGVLKGDVQLIKMLWERMDGKVADRIEITDADVEVLPRLKVRVRDDRRDDAGGKPAGTGD